MLIGGCHPGDCHYQEATTRRCGASGCCKRMLKEMGIEEDRFRLEWISAAEADTAARVMNDMVEKVRALGPLRLRSQPKRVIRRGGELG